ncbi:MAG: hypothetical protein K2H19_06040, partial [Ruminococcus sp.]|nr:hypothetical protein [Ruminococcus sp.]
VFDNDYNNGKGFYGNPAFAYLSDEWAYMPKFAGLSDNPFSSNNTGIVKTYKPCAWHYLSEKDSFTTTISYSQMKLVKDKNYNVYVYAVRNDKDAICLISPIQTAHGGYNKEYSIDLTQSELVYNSAFICRNPAEFDSNNNSNGTYAYNSDDDEIYRRATAYVDDNGEVKLEKVDTNAFLSPSGDYSGTAWNNSTKNTVSSDISQLSINFASFYKFVNSVLGYFPKNVQSLYSLGFLSIIVLGMVKVVFK